MLISFSWPRQFARLFSVLLFANLLLVVLAACQEDLYQYLELTRGASKEQVRTSYLKLVKKHHPDKGGNVEAFTKIQLAYDILYDDDKRSIYHDTGKTDFNSNDEQRGGSGFPFDMFFNQGGREWGSGSGQRAKKRDTVIPVYVPLQDLYKGIFYQIKVQKQSVCSACQGTGAHGYDGIHVCSACKGQGHRVVRQMIGPGMYTMMHAQCDKCNGKGKIIKKKCPVCKASKVMSKFETEHVEIKPGSKEGDRIELRNIGDSSPDYEPGDVIFEIRTPPNGIAHPQFVREGHNLHITIVISLNEALFGFNRSIQHMDGRKINHKRNEITNPSQVVMISEEGMPIKDSDSRGHLFVKHRVVMPTGLSKEKLDKLREILTS